MSPSPKLTDEEKQKYGLYQGMALAMPQKAQEWWALAPEDF